jgi:hypothetical protein
MTARRDPRRTALLAIVPLAVIAIGLFVPPIVRTRPGVVATPPFADGPNMFWSVQVTAGALSVLTAVRELLRRAPGGLDVALAIAGMAAVGYVWADVIPFCVAAGARGIAFALVVSLAAPVALLVVALRRQAWDRWVCVIGAYTLVVAMFGCPYVPGGFDQFSGGYTFIAADATLLALVALQLVGTSRRPA